MKTGVFLTHFNRPHCLERSLPEVAAAAREVGAEVIVVDDGSPREASGRVWEACREHGAALIPLPSNRGLAGAVNMALSWFLADTSVEAICMIQDDTSADPIALAACLAVLRDFPSALVTGNSPPVKSLRPMERPEHAIVREFDAPCGIHVQERQSCRGTMMLASADSWRKVMPIRSRGLGFPKRVPRAPTDPEQRGEGSGVDWFVCRDSPNRIAPVLCVPNMVRIFAWEAKDSSWGNQSKSGPDDPLSRDALKGWKR